jgi:hypothetical protein
MRSSMMGMGWFVDNNDDGNIRENGVGGVSWWRNGINWSSISDNGAIGGDGWRENNSFL